MRTSSVPLRMSSRTSSVACAMSLSASSSMWVNRGMWRKGLQWAARGDERKNATAKHRRAFPSPFPLRLTAAGAAPRSHCSTQSLQRSVGRPRARLFLRGHPRRAKKGDNCCTAEGSFLFVPALSLSFPLSFDTLFL